MLQSAFGEYLAAAFRRHRDEPGRDRAAGRPRSAMPATLDTPAVRKLIAAEHRRRPHAHRRADRRRPRHRHFGALELGDEALEMVRRPVPPLRRRRSRCRMPTRGTCKDELIPLRDHRADGRARRVRPDRAGGVRRARAWASSRCAWSPRSCRAAISASARSARARRSPAELIRLGGTEEQKQALAAAASPRGETPADGGVHRAQHRLRPRPAQDARRARRRCLQDHGNKTWITHAARADIMTCWRAPIARSPATSGLSMFLAEKPRGTDDRSVPGQGHERRRDRGARLSRHEGIRDRLRRLRGAGREPARRAGRPGLQAAHGDLRERAHPDRGARRRRGAERARAGPALRPGAHPVRPSRSMPSRASPASSPGWRSRP